jgi:hypothetical protein
VLDDVRKPVGGQCGEGGVKPLGGRLP